MAVMTKNDTVVLVKLSCTGTIKLPKSMGTFRMVKRVTENKLQVQFIPDRNIQEVFSLRGPWMKKIFPPFSLKKHGDRDKDWYRCIELLLERQPDGSYCGSCELTHEWYMRYRSASSIEADKVRGEDTLWEEV